MRKMFQKAVEKKLFAYKRAQTNSDGMKREGAQGANKYETKNWPKSINVSSHFRLGEASHATIFTCVNKLKAQSATAAATLKC